MLERFTVKFNEDGPVPEYAPQLGPCWWWTATLSTGGYGQFWDGSRLIQAHRWSYEFFIGPILDGLQLDHLCRVRNCVNPSHLEPVTQKENLARGESPSARGARKTHCPHGHEYAGYNLHISPRGGRLCRACNRARSLKTYYGKKGNE